DTDNPFVGRSDSIKKIHDQFNMNLNSFKKQSKTKVDYGMIQISGLMGKGKSRLAVESCKQWQEKYENCKTIFIDFSRSDVIDKIEMVGTSSVLIGIRIAAKFFFGINTYDLVNLVGNNLRKFSITEVSKIISLECIKDKNEPFILNII